MLVYRRLKDLKSLFLVSRDRASIPRVHALLILSGIISRGSSSCQLIASYARIDYIQVARKVFDTLSHRGIDSWNAIIIAYSRKDSPVEVLNLYRQMNLEGVRPDSSTFTVALKACTSLLDLEMGEEIRRRAGECGYEYDLFVGSSVLNLYAKCGMMDEASYVFEKMPRRDLVCWTTMISGFSQCGQWNEAIEIYRQMRKEGLEGDGIVMLGLIQACANIGDAKVGQSLHGCMIRRYLPMDVVVETSLVDMYAKNGNLELASFVFRRMNYRNGISWSALISGCAQNGFASNVLELLIEMQSFGFKPDLVSIVSALLASSQIGFLKSGKAIHGYIVRNLDSDQVLSTALIDMYSKCGMLASACTLFDQISFRDSISWNAMIASYGTHGHGKEALSLFLKMIDTNSKPDHTTFASLLSALSHSGLVDEGLHWFDLMVSEFNIEPSEKHYICVVDLLSRGGRVNEAYDVIQSMKNESGIAMWVALLSGCHNHGKFLIGELAAKKVLELNPENPGIYALVSNFFAAAKRWNEVAGVRVVMKKTTAKKVPGYSVLEIDGALHTFIMEDKSHSQHQHILEILEKLDLQMMGVDHI